MMYYDFENASGWSTYWFEKNLMGDIVAVYDEYGTLLVSYRYTGYGDCYLTSHNGGYNTPAYDNPFMFRGYYYDKDLNLYRLGTRYYDAKICRFINADKVMSGANGELVGCNLYVYCFNNPVMFTDENGNWPEWGDKFLAHEIYNVVHSLNTNNPEKRAKDRGYHLQ